MQGTDLPWHVVQELINAALSGVGEVDLVAVLGTTLNAAGVDVCTIEIACDAVDPERADHFIRWHRDGHSTEQTILAGDVFRTMLDRNSEVLRYQDASEVFAPVMADGATDAVAFVCHLAPAVTLGFFDDVMSAFVTERSGRFGATDIDLLRQVMPAFALVAQRAPQYRRGAHPSGNLPRQRGRSGDAGRPCRPGGHRQDPGSCDLLRPFGLYVLDERLDPRSLIEHLNMFFETITRPVSRAGGQVAGHVGDAVVMFFPIPDVASQRDLCATAVRAALAGLHDLDRLNRSQFLATPLRARIGIDTGEVVHGNIGSPGRFSFTIIGTPVNRAARLQALAKDLGATLLMTADLAEAAAVPCRPFGKHTLRGLEQPVEVVGLGIADGPTGFRLQMSGDGDGQWITEFSRPWLSAAILLARCSGFLGRSRFGFC